MSAWVPLSAMIRELQAGGGPPPPASELRRAAAERALHTFGPLALELPALVNVAALALSMPCLTVHRISAGAARMVTETDLHSLPGEPPRLLQGSWLLESRRPEEPLFGNTACLGGYPLDGAIYLVGLQYPDGATVARWTPHWRAEDLAAGVVREDSPLIADVDAHHAWSREAARFVVVLSLLLMAEGSPVQVDDERPRGPRARRKEQQPSPSGEWVVRRVRLGRITPTARRISAVEPQPADLTGRQAAVLPVRGHLKRQPYGPQAALRRWIYIEGYEARRWVAPKPLRIEVSP